MSIETSMNLLDNQEDFTPRVQKGNLMNWGLRVDDLLAILALLILTLAATAYIQSMIRSCLENAESFRAVLNLP
jgi:hypothetical protein